MSTIFGNPGAIANARSAEGSARLTQDILNGRFNTLIDQMEKDYGADIAAIVRGLEETHKITFVTQHWHEILDIGHESLEQKAMRQATIAPQREALEAQLAKVGAEALTADIHDNGLLGAIRRAQGADLELDNAIATEDGEMTRSFAVDATEAGPRRPGGDLQPKGHQGHAKRPEGGLAIGGSDQ